MGADEQETLGRPYTYKTDKPAMIVRAKLNEKKRIYRDISISPSNDLQTLALHVVEALGFDLDHSYGFFQSPDVFGKGMATKHYELFYDLGQGGNSNTGSTARTTVADIFKATKDKWWMLFDYGYEWIFELECRSIDNDGPKSGTVIKISGEAPQQYEDDPEDWD